MEKELTTKEKIIYESLKLFSSKGYKGVSMREIAAAVGIKGASIYNHFSGKEEIFKAIFREMKKKYDELAKMTNIPTKLDENMVNYYKNSDENQLLYLTEVLLKFYCKDEFVSMFRKILTCEQHRSTLAGEMLKQYYFEAPVLFQAKIFEGLQKTGQLKSIDANIMALHFYSPIYYVMCEYDLGYPYETCLEKLKKHVHVFCEIYATCK